MRPRQSYYEVTESTYRETQASQNTNSWAPWYRRTWGPWRRLAVTVLVSSSFHMLSKSPSEPITTTSPAASSTSCTEASAAVSVSALVLGLAIWKGWLNECWRTSAGRRGRKYGRWMR